MPIFINGTLTFSNQTRSNTLWIGNPKINNYFQLLGEFPSSIESRSEIKSNLYLAVSALWNIVDNKKLSVPIKLTKGSVTTEGLLRVYLSGGDYYPDYLVIEIHFSEKLSVSYRVKVDSIENEFVNVVSLGNVDIILSDAHIESNYDYSSKGLEDFLTQVIIKTQ